MAVESRPVGVAGNKQRKRLYVYWCLANRHGRRSRNEVCPNNLTVPMRLLDAAVIGCIAPYLTAEVIANAVAEAVKRAGSRSALASDRVRLEGELKTVETEIANLVAFVKQGKGSEAVQTELATAEATRGTLRTALDRLVATEALRTSTAQVEQTLTAILKDWQDIRSKPVAQQRQLLRKLVPDRIAVTPHVRGDRKWVDWHGAMALAPIVSGITPALGDAVLMGRRWWPQREDPGVDGLDLPRSRGRAGGGVKGDIRALRAIPRARSRAKSRRSRLRLAWRYRPFLHSVEDLAALRLVLLFCDEPLVAHRLEFVQAVSVTSLKRSCAWPDDFAGISFQAEIGPSIGFVPTVSKVGDDGSRSGRFEPRTDEFDEPRCPLFGRGKRAATRVVVPISMNFFPAGVGANPQGLQGFDGATGRRPSSARPRYSRVGRRQRCRPHSAWGRERHRLQGPS